MHKFFLLFLVLLASPNNAATLSGECKLAIQNGDKDAAINITKKFKDVQSHSMELINQMSACFAYAYGQPYKFDWASKKF